MAFSFTAPHCRTLKVGNMNKEWSELNKTMQAQLRKKETYAEGISTLLELRKRLMDTIISFRNDLSGDEFNVNPFINADGCHNATVTYSLWHIFRIEDIVAHTLINGDEQIFFSGKYKERIRSPIITTGNELERNEISGFSKQLVPDELYSYISEVRESTETILRGLSYEMLKQKISPERREILQNLNVVSDNEDAIWLIDYWCGKDIRGLIQMPFSRHWIMHT